MQICVFGASSNSISERHKTAAENLGKNIVQRGHDIVYGAGASGVMGAVATGAFNAGGKITGVVPSFFEDQDMGVDGRIFKNCTELIKTGSMRERKFIMEDKADAFIIAPGGIGTFEEFFEVFTLKQLGRHNKAIAIFNVDGYYNAMFDMLANAINENFLRESCSMLYKVFDNADEMLDYIENYNPVDINVFDYKNIERI